MSDGGSSPGTKPRGLLSNRGFRAVLIANIMAAIAFGTSRFVLVWLVGELTDWNPATAILGIVIGIPPLALSAWAGALADRMSPRQLGRILFAASAVVFLAVGVLVAADAMTVPLAIATGFVATIAPSMSMPLYQAIVPTVTPPGKLMQAVALQNLSMMVSVIGGLFLGGAVMQIGGTEAGFWLLTVASVLGFVVVSRGGIPDRLAGAHPSRTSVRDGARQALALPALRTLLAITLVMGVAIATTSLLLPEFARDVLGKDSLAASALNVAMSVGMMSTAMVIATRWTPHRAGLVLTLFTLGPLGGGLIAIGATRTYLVTALCCFGWGLSGGIAMTLLRTLTQANTPPALMGQVMGLASMAQNGAFPLTALALFPLVETMGLGNTMMVVGAGCCVALWIISIRPHVRILTSHAEPVAMPVAGELAS